MSQNILDIRQEIIRHFDMKKLHNCSRRLKYLQMSRRVSKCPISIPDNPGKNQTFWHLKYSINGKRMEKEFFLNVWYISRCPKTFQTFVEQIRHFDIWYALIRLKSLQVSDIFKMSGNYRIFFLKTIINFSDI